MQDYRRPEAQFLGWSTMTSSQQEAAVQVAEILLDTIRRVGPESNDQPRRPRRPAAPRYSQLAFIDGDRGMGKTSLLLSFQHLDEWKSDPADAAETIRDPREETAFPKAISDLIESRERIVWLETLDMEPLGRSSDLFVAILVRLLDVLTSGRTDPRHPRREDRRGEPGIDMRRALFDFPGDEDLYDEALRSFDDLLHKAVLAWNGPNPERSHRIDPDTFAVETRRGEEASLQLHGKLEKALDLLAELTSQNPRGPQNPIFALPVDDFDLAPTRCLELLRLIRTIAPARLFFLVAGNIRLAEEVLRLQTEGELAQVAGGKPTKEMWQRRLSPVATEIAANNLRKLLPPAQRASLRHITVRKALGFRLPMAESDLGEVLGKIKFQRNVALDWEKRVSLKDFLCIDDRPLGEGYFGAQWLGGTPRQVQDLLLELNRHLGPVEDWGESLIESLRELLFRESREEWRLEFGDREILEGLFEEFGTKKFDFVGQTRFDHRLRLDWEEPVAHGTVVALQPMDSQVYLRQEIVTESWQEPRRERSYVEIPRRLAAGTTLLHDLAITLWGGNLPTGSLLNEESASRHLVQMQWGSAGSTDRRGRGSVTVPWHQPEWWTIRDYQRFVETWRSYSRRPSGSRSSTLEHRVIAWMISILEVVLDEPHQPGSRKVFMARHRVDLFRRLLQEPIQHTTARRKLRRSALLAIVLNLAPECGVTTEVAEKVITKDFRNLLIELLKDSGWAQEIRTYRARWAYEAEPRDSVDKGAIALYTAIVPKRAADWFVEVVQRRSLNLGALDEHTDMEHPPVVSQESLDRFKKLVEQRFEPLSYYVKVVDEFLEDRAEADPSSFPWYIGNVRQMVSFLQSARPPMSNDFEQHPINTLLGGALVPSEEEIAQAASQR